MCGFVGTVDVPLTDRAIEEIAHRGPDDSGRIDVSVGRHQVSIAHRRLAIVDPSTSGAQPMKAGTSHVIAYNGEVYNHAELRGKYRVKDFRGHSDTETVCQCFAKAGIDVCGDFNGIFAFAALDIPNARLYLVRDGFGVKPLYYARLSDTLVFASELGPLHHLMRDQLDLGNLAELLRLRFSPSPDTLFRHVRKVRPGHVVTVDLSTDSLSVTERSFGSAFEHPARSGDYRQTVSIYGELLNEAVERQLMADVEIGVLLSGGLDSALIAQEASRNLPYRMKAFTVGYSGGGMADEVQQARDTAQRFGLDHHVTLVSESDFFDSLDECASVVEEPLATTSIVPMSALVQLASTHVKVVLSGQGADELNGGYLRYRLELIRNSAPTIAKALPGLVSPGTCRIDGANRALRYLQVRTDIDRLLASYEVFSPSEILAMTGIVETKARDRASDVLRASTGKPMVERMMHADARFNLSDDLLLYTDKISMRRSLEVRVPFLDLRLAAFLEAQPYRFKVRSGRGKLLLRSLASRRLSPGSRHILRRRKNGFEVPAASWFRHGNRIDELLLSPGRKLHMYLDKRFIEDLLAQHRHGRDRTRQLFLLLTLGNWLERFA